MNAKIEEVIIGFDEISGRNGRQFNVKLILQVGTRHNCVVEINPLRLPQLLECLGFENVNALIGKIIQTDSDGWNQVTKIANALDNDNWFYVDTGKYFGSDLFELGKVMDKY